METTIPKKRGPVPKGLVDTHIRLPEWLVEWAKVHPEGLSSMLRRLLAEEYARQQRRKGTDS
jgi:hypothetical protein